MGGGLEGGQIIWENFNALGEEIGARFESELSNVESLGKNVQEMLEDKLKEVYGDVIAVDVEGFGENITTMFEDKLREIYGDISDDFDELGEVIVTEVQNEWAKVETEWPKMCGGECQGGDSIDSGQCSFENLFKLFWALFAILN